MGKFKANDIVYYIGKETPLLKHDAEYVVFNKIPNNAGYIQLGVVDPDHSIVINTKSGYMKVSDEGFISKEEYEKKEKSPEDKFDRPFKKGDIAYYIGDTNMLKKDTPYEVGDSKYGTGGWIIGLKVNNVPVGFHHTTGQIGENDKLWIQIKNLITKEEYEKRKKKQPTTNQLKIDFSGDKEPSKSRNAPFNTGDIVYFVGDSVKLKKEEPYEILNCFLKGKDSKGRNIYAATLKSKEGSIFSHESGDFISEEEYKSGGKKTVSNFKFGDEVYYVGNNMNLFELIEKNKPYKVSQSPSVSVTDELLIPIYTDRNQLLHIPENEFVSKEEYEKNSLEDPSYTAWQNHGPISKESTGNLNGRKSDSEIKLKLFKDTKDENIKWERPYPTHNEWFRAKKYLQNPKNAYLRFELKRQIDEWELWVYYHRDKIKDAVTIRKMRQSDSLLRLIRKVETMVEKQDDEDNDQRFQYTHD